MDKQIVVFELDAESFAVDISAVESIIKVQAVTVMPQAPKFVEGVTNLRGKVLPVIDLRKRFGMPSRESDRNSRIIVVNIDGAGVGMIVDGVSEVLTISEGAVEAAPSITTTIDSTFITGIAKVGDRLVILLDLGKILSANEQDKIFKVAATA
jgi:purine-binding chemotaxis protein CheW